MNLETNYKFTKHSVYITYAVYFIVHSSKERLYLYSCMLSEMSVVDIVKY